MCMLILEIVMFILGLIGLIAGKLTLSKAFVLEGKRARIAGGILLLPLPLAFLAGIVLGLLISVGMLPSNITDYAWCIEILIVAGCLGGAFLYAQSTKPPADSSTPPASPPLPS